MGMWANMIPTPNGSNKRQCLEQMLPPFRERILWGIIFLGLRRLTPGYYLCHIQRQEKRKPRGENPATK